MMPAIIGTSVGAVIVATLIVSSAGAQVPASALDPGSASHVAPDVFPTQYFTLDDTNRVAFGHRGWSRYDTPSACLNAPREIERLVYRAQVNPRDTARNKLGADTLSLRARDIARACGARFAVERVTPPELPSVVELALMMGDDAMARAASEQYLTSLGSDSLRGWGFRHIMHLYLTAAPPRFTEFLTMAPRLDSLRRRSGVQAPGLLARDARQAALTEAITRFDVDRMEPLLWAVMKNTDTLTRAEQIDFEGGDEKMVAMSYLLGIEVRHDPGHALARLRKKAADSGVVIPSDPQLTQFFEMIATAIDRVGELVPPLQAQYWFGDSAAPVRGKVTLILSMQGPTRSDEIQRLRRLVDTYQDSLAIVLVVRTQGFFGASGPLDPADEAKRIATFYRERQKLRATVAVQETQFAKDRFGRLEPRGVSFGMPSDSASGVPAGSIYSLGDLLIDQYGKLIWGGQTLRDEELMETLIDRALGREQ